MRIIISAFRMILSIPVVIGFLIARLIIPKEEELLFNLKDLMMWVVATDWKRSR